MLSFYVYKAVFYSYNERQQEGLKIPFVCQDNLNIFLGVKDMDEKNQMIAQYIWAHYIHSSCSIY